MAENVEEILKNAETQVDSPYYIEPWTRETLADGVQLQDTTIQPLKDRDILLASEIESVKESVNTLSGFSAINFLDDSIIGKENITGDLNLNIDSNLSGEISPDDSSIKIGLNKDISVESVNADSISSTNLNSTKCSVDKLESTEANITNLSSNSSNITDLNVDKVSGSTGIINTLTTVSFNSKNSNISSLNTATISSTDITTTNLSSNNAELKSIKVSGIETNNVETHSLTVEGSATISTATINTGIFTNIEVQNITAYQSSAQNISGVSAIYADETSNSIISGFKTIKTDTIESNSLETYSLSSKTISGDTLEVNDLTATNISAKNISGNVTGNLTGDVTGKVTGDLKGNVSSTNISATNISANSITATTISGLLNGNVSGDVSGNLIGTATYATEALTALTANSISGPGVLTPYIVTSSITESSNSSNGSAVSVQSVYSALSSVSSDLSISLSSNSGTIIITPNDKTYNFENTNLAINGKGEVAELAWKDDLNEYLKTDDAETIYQPKGDYVSSGDLRTLAYEDVSGTIYGTDSEGNPSGLKVYSAYVAYSAEKAGVQDSYLNRALNSDLENKGISSDNTNSSYNFIIGSGNSANKGFTYGLDNTVDNYSVALGSNIIVNYANQTVIGKFNKNQENNLFEIGYGESNTNRNNAFAVNNDGSISSLINSNVGNTVPNRGINYLKSTKQACGRFYCSNSTGRTNNYINLISYEYKIPKSGVSSGKEIKLYGDYLISQNGGQNTNSTMNCISTWVLAFRFVGTEIYYHTFETVQTLYQKYEDTKKLGTLCSKCEYTTAEDGDYIFTIYLGWYQDLTYSRNSNYTHYSISLYLNDITDSSCRDLDSTKIHYYNISEFEEIIDDTYHLSLPLKTILQEKTDNNITTEILNTNVSAQDLSFSNLYFQTSKNYSQGGLSLTKELAETVNNNKLRILYSDYNTQTSSWNDWYFRGIASASENIQYSIMGGGASTRTDYKPSTDIFYMNEGESVTRAHIYADQAAEADNCNKINNVTYTTATALPATLDQNTIYFI